MDSKHIRSKCNICEVKKQPVIKIQTDTSKRAAKKKQEKASELPNKQESVFDYVASSNDAEDVILGDSLGKIKLLVASDVFIERKVLPFSNDAANLTCEICGFKTPKTKPSKARQKISQARI